MKVFLLAPSYLNLYEPIQEELERQGHTVTYYEDIVSFPGWVNSRKSKILTMNANPAVVFWRCRFYGKQRRIFWKRYDLFLCINGVSFHPVLLDQLKRRNRKLRSALYVWDTSKYYDYYRYYMHFDKVMSFDIDDSDHFKVLFLPFYWLPTNDSGKRLKDDYVLSIVGSNHDGRLEIVEKIAKRLDDNDLKYCFKLYNAPETSPFFISRPMSFDETLDIMKRSSCILDTDRPTQTGTTPRVIWALALGKKIISTNTNLTRMSFYDENHIMIIDRNNPSVDLDFIKNSEDSVCNQVNDFISELRIDKWVRTLIS